MTENAPAGQSAEPEAEREAHGQPDPNTDADSDTTIGPQPTPDPNQDDGGYIVEKPENRDFGKELVDGISDAIPNSVDVEIPKVELTNKDAITASRNDLSSNLTSMGDIVSNLNSNASSNSQALINDVRAISNQINKIGQTLSGASDNIKDPDDIVDDISDEDTDDDVEAKVTNCINSGVVNADINAGGITGGHGPGERPGPRGRLHHRRQRVAEFHLQDPRCGPRLHELRHRQRQKAERGRHRR